MAAGVFGYLGYDMVRLMEDTLAAPAARSDRHSRRDLAAADPGGRFRRREGHDHGRDAGAAASRRQRRGRACARRRALVGGRRRARPAARQIGAEENRRWPARRRAALEYDAGRNSSAWCCAPRNTSPPATFFRWCCRSASRRRSRLRRSRSIARCGASIRRRTCSSSIAARLRSPARARKSWSKTSGGTVTIRPVAGTRRRGATPHEDKALEEELLADPKERAEHLMLLDLGRNDVGRVAEIGSVEVTDQFFIERFSQVMHIVSNVRGQAARRLRCARRARRRLSRRHRLGRAEGARHADHRRAGEGKARRSTPAASAISRPPPTWIPASCCAPR